MDNMSPSQAIQEMRRIKLFVRGMSAWADYCEAELYRLIEEVERPSGGRVARLNREEARHVLRLFITRAEKDIDKMKEMAESVPTL